MLRLRKLMQVACTATVALTVFSCSQDEFEMTNGKGNTTITATFEGAGGNTRTTDKRPISDCMARVRCIDIVLYGQF